ncbi:primosomal protein N' [Spirochaetota bacterium]
MFADVYIGYPLETRFTYKIPPDMQVVPGIRVKVDFANRKKTAFVVKVHGDEPKDFKTKDILEVIDDEVIFDDRLVELSEFIASSYLATAGEALSMALPSGLKPSQRYKIPFERKKTGELFFSGEQELVYNSIMESLGNDELFHLIHGITGSGKTEIYIEAAKYFIKNNKSVIYLVPEISISSQIFERLYNVFGDELIIYHSHLTPNQRLNNWMRFYKGDSKIAIGTRSAAFLQAPDLGLIIIDEENDGSYKEHSTPRYNARRVAFYRSKKEKALLIMGSATPSVETLYAAEKGIIKLHQLKTRYGNAKLPEIEIVKINPSKKSNIISSMLKLNTKRAIEKGSQAIYLLNRRGFSPFVICNSCGKAVECPHCNISMNFHKEGDVICHYCGLKQRLPETCSGCGSDDLNKIGTGTQRVENIIHDEFEDFRIMRLDQDSSRKKGAVFEIIEKMESGEVDILLGTQMVAKGFDFPNVTVVGVILADIGLNMPDFRSSERIFSLLLQVAGRCGRGDLPGRVILQTVNRDHYIYDFLINHDYYGFYKHELEIRKMLDYPPFTRIARLLVRGKDEGTVKESIEKLNHSIIKNKKKFGSDIVVLGPSQAPLAKIAGSYRHHILLKSRDLDIIKEVITSSRKAVVSNDVYLEIDIDPYDIM